MIDRLGTTHLPKLFALKGKATAILNRLPLLPKEIPDKCLQWLSTFFADQIPQRLLDFRDRFEHHLILKVSDNAIEEATQYFNYSTLFINKQGDNQAGTLVNSDYIICNQEEAKMALLHRFAAAGAAVRYQTIHQDTVEDILALDVALPRNRQDWLESLPKAIEEKLLHTLYYRHFFCHVFHQDYILKKGVDIEKLKEDILKELDKKTR
ncbi:MAG: D-lactate dehydrogenase [Candidatus Endobugula sp.]|jgi:D-lactate dehydrogenase